MLEQSRDGVGLVSERDSARRQQEPQAQQMRASALERAERPKYVLVPRRDGSVMFCPAAAGGRTLVVA